MGAIKPARRRDWIFLLVTLVASAMAASALIPLLRTTRVSEYYSHIVLIPAVSAYMIFRRRREMFRGTASAHPWGIAATAAGAGLFAAGVFLRTSLDVRASIATMGALLFWVGAYLILYGKGGGRRAVFPLAFLIFAVPVPVFAMRPAIAGLVVGSTYVTRLLFTALGVPFVQEGPVFHLPGLAIQVAQECSGIRSSLALLITAVLAGEIFLRKAGHKVMLAVAVLPVALLKNAVRIVTLNILSYFVDMRIIKGGFLHRSGGFLFFGLGLAVLASVLWLLGQAEARRGRD